ncbi:MAG: hypothetical protein R3D25_15585 [Geminicoccaceae bacterium]
MAKPEEHFTEEHDTDSIEHEKELDRVSDEEHHRADAQLKQAMDSVVASNKALVTEIQTLVAKLNTQVATEAMKPKVSEHKGVVITDETTGKTELAAKEQKVSKVLKHGDSQDKGNANGAATEGKLGKTAAFCAIVTAGGPFMLQVFQLFRDAMDGKDISGALANAANEAAIMGLARQWQGETDQAYWGHFADYFQTHTAIVDTAQAAGAQPVPTGADLVLILHYASILNPVQLTANFVWSTAKEKADKVDELKKVYDPSISGKVNFIKSLANIKVNGQAVPRGVQANLGEIAVADAL